ncbi:MAG: DNA polymerase ligase N-terminal domain-containing protein [Thermoguttaceae bacterium]
MNQKSMMSAIVDVYSEQQQQKMPLEKLHRFVILEHSHPAGIHWDVMLATNGVLKTWQISPLWISEEENKHTRKHGGISFDVVGIPLEDHRLAYLDYEGEVSAGKSGEQRGAVRRIDSGTWESISPTRFCLNGIVFDFVTIEGQFGDIIQFCGEIFHKSLDV